MFDPTIYDNLKVVFEGAMYDMDLDGSVQIIQRTDRVELSSMSRCFGMEAVRRQKGLVIGRIMLTASLADLAAELLSQPDEQPGCGLELTFIFPIREVEPDCAFAAKQMIDIWGDKVSVAQSIHMEYGKQPLKLENHLTIQFSRKLDERQIDDIPSLLEHFLLSLERLDQHFFTE
ncbi:hypothetical protein GC093_11220 [Paenibacillus sp. LMG 31456]|uniref:Group-specific protein n=1 Tax=Paenibacillus foliorum TaxID=2654974 RepID=A0A972JYQ6_9BACL|nr:hypothetical protein [Paenibacillus foliorum]NOU93789.1 hypothetical protein [Paenibacillus foliorum]